MLCEICQYVERAASLLGLEKTKPVPRPLAASDRNHFVSDEQRRDKVDIFSPIVVLLVLLYMGHDRRDAACAIRLLACDLCDANEDSL